MQYWNASLDIVIKNVRYNNLDWVHCNTGREGTGKSTLALLSCMKFPGFKADYIAFNGQEFNHLLTHVPEGSAVMFDEGAEGLFSRDSMSKFNKQIVKTLMHIRGRNLFICINIPDFTSLDRGLRNRRVMSLTETRYVVSFDKERNYKKLIRGYFYFYDASKLDGYYRDDRGLLHAPQPTYVDTFPSLEGTEIWVEYNKRKQEFYKKKALVASEVSKRIESAAVM